MKRERKPIRVTSVLGQKFGDLTVMKYSHANSHVYYFCRCKCGSIKSYRLSHLRRSESTSCGCSRLKHKHTVNHTKSTTYTSWDAMIQRCTNGNNPKYYAYGKRGIKICKEWLESFRNFLADMGNRPLNTSLDRINVNGNYEPSNCRWATPKEQANNRRIYA